MNYQWYYFLFPNGTANFSEILPDDLDIKEADTSYFKLDSRQNEVKDSISFIINSERLLHFLKKGHFQVVEKREAYALVDFHQPIANIVSITNDTVATM